jgi:glycosyltransferase involved in cell wall biosynthesis
MNVEQQRSDLEQQRSDEGRTTVSGIAIFHDNMAQMGGAERVTQALASALPGAVLHTTLAAPWKLVPELRDMNIRTTWMRHLPAPDRLYRHYFLLYPFAVESADLRDYDLIVSNCWGYAKGVRKRPDALHVCYCQTPMRWAWRYDDYVARERMGIVKRRVLPWLIKPLRQWDLRASKRPDFFIANSSGVAARIQQFYGRPSVVIHPPIDLARFRVTGAPGDFYLIVARLVAYKRIDLAIRACNLLRRTLVIVGDGPDRARLESLSGPTIEFRGRQPDDVVTELASSCRGLLFPGEEDFGMVPLEANASGRPVVAWKGGGALDTVREGQTGVFFTEPTAESLAAAIEELEGRVWDSATLRSHAAGFDVSVFTERIRSFLQTVAPAGHLQRALAPIHG